MLLRGVEGCQTTRQTTTPPSQRGFCQPPRCRSARSRGRRCRYNRCPPAPDREGSGGVIQYAARVRGGRPNTAPWRISICRRVTTEVRHRGRESAAVRREQFAEVLLRSLV